MFCAQCGKKIKDDAKFCGFCGHQVRRPGGADVPVVPPVRHDVPVAPAPVAGAVPVAHALVPSEPIPTSPEHPAAPESVPHARRDDPAELNSRPLAFVDSPAPDPIPDLAQSPVSKVSPAERTSSAGGDMTVPADNSVPADRPAPVAVPMDASTPSTPTPQNGPSTSSEPAALPEPSVKPTVSPNDMRNFLIGSAVVVAVFGLCTAGAVTYRLGVWGGAKASGPESVDAQMMTVDVDPLERLSSYLR